MPMTTPRAVAVSRVVGLVAGVIAAALVVVLGPFGMGLVLGPPLVALGLLLGVVIGEAALRRPRRPTTQGWVRALPSAVPRNLTIAVLGALVLVVIGVVVAWVTADDDTFGRGGRALRIVCVSGQSATATPWPGSHFSVPLAIALGAGVLAAAIGLLLVARHPAGGTEEDDPRRLRSRAGRAVVEGTVAVITAGLGSIALTMGTVLVNIACAPTGLRIAGWVLLVLAVVALLVALRYIGRLIFGPAGRAPRHGAD
ncbi:hypothetical protein EK0264_05355 [Epidermidibacterium keratini]|uniref:Uncharacterized protein n=1 Tax=Epidermidibacterium keratini TaxID=1891644 RepID=A0A7L4YLL2_9ACTN|nr:hypothetical protein [Epidermidibacterium keratini]QHB99762.1 hypothetical protein EK0264_05355 [Epidermidibacterium keratini]